MLCCRSVNKWLFFAYDFRYPFLLTCSHMVACHILSGFALRFTSLGAKASGDPSPAVLHKVWLLSVAFCLSVAAGNVALKFIYVSFAQMIGASEGARRVRVMVARLSPLQPAPAAAATPMVTTIMSRVLTGKRHHRMVYVAMVPMSLGCILCVKGEVNFHMIGFLALVVATLLRGVKVCAGAVLLNGRAVRLLTRATQDGAWRCVVVVQGKAGLAEVRRVAAPGVSHHSRIAASCTT